MTRVLVCGGRDYGDEARVFAELDRIGPTFVMEGGAGGADAWAWRWARRNLPPECRRTYVAEWSKHGNMAGPKRNQLMLEQGRPDLVLAFPGGKGTADMVRRARRAGVEVVEIAP